MEFTLDQLLTIVGRLDDAPGFDTPRERFRRLLHARMTGLGSARRVADECRAHSGEQSHRALQDAVVLYGRFLGFETAFGRYSHDPGAMPAHGCWYVRRGLHVTLTLCSDQIVELNPDTVAHGVTEGEVGYPRIGLLVVTPLFAARERLENTLAAGKHPNLRLISLDGLLHLCSMVVAGQITTAHVVELLYPNVTLDARLDLLEHVAARGREGSGTDVVSPPGGDRFQTPRYWVNAMRPEPLTPTDRVVSSLIATRQILGINPPLGVEDRVRPGDAICVFVAGRGIVAHARIAGILTDGSRMIRDSERFTHVLRLSDVSVYDAPLMPSEELASKLDLALTGDAPAITTPVSPREFASITAQALSQTG